MSNITHQFGTLFHPVKALLIYKPQDYGTAPCYVESYEISPAGTPINAHPLTVQEGQELIKALTIKTKKENNQRFLNPWD